MKFKVFHDFLGAQDGVVVTEFKAGEVVEISDYLAPHISRWARPLDEVKVEATPPPVAQAQAGQVRVDQGRPQIKLKRDY